MFGGSGLGGALKNLGSKAEELLEKKKKEVEELAVQKKNMATELLQSQIKKTGELLTQTVSEAEKVAVNTVEEAKHEAIDAFDAEVAKVEKSVDDGLKQAATVVDSKLKEADDFLDKKRDEVVTTVETTKKQTEESMQDASAQLLGKARGLLNFIKDKLDERTNFFENGGDLSKDFSRENFLRFIIHCWLSSSAPTARPSYVMPGGGKKAVFPTLNLHDHDQVRMSTNDQDRQKKLLQSRGKSLELKEVLEKEKTDGPNKTKTKNQPSGSKSVEKPGNGKSEQQKTPTKSEQKALHKLEQQQIKSEQKAQQKLEKEQQKLEKEHQKEQLKLEKEQLKLEKEQKKIGMKGKPNDYCTSLREGPQLKTQKSVDLSFLKHQKSLEGPRQLARKSVDMQYKQDLLGSTDFASFSSAQLKSKK